MKALSNGGESTSSKLQDILDENATVTIHLSNYRSLTTPFNRYSSSKCFPLVELVSFDFPLVELASFDFEDFDGIL
jgi:hypothetical protein